MELYPLIFCICHQSFHAKDNEGLVRLKTLIQKTKNTNDPVELYLTRLVPVVLIQFGASLSQELLSSSLKSCWGHCSRNKMIWIEIGAVWLLTVTHLSSLFNSLFLRNYFQSFFVAVNSPEQFSINAYDKTSHFFLFFIYL